MAGATFALSIRPSQQHLGKLSQFEGKEFSFEIENNSTETIKIMKVQHSCGCTESKVEKEILAPGEKSRIVGSLNAQDRMGEFGSQIVVSFLTGLTGLDGGESAKYIQEAKMLVGARAVSVLNTPGQMELGETLLGKEPKAVSFEVSRGEADLEWDDLEIKTESLKSRIIKIGEDRWQITLTPPKGEVIGTQREEVEITLLNSQNKLNPENPVQLEQSPGRPVKILVSWKTSSAHFALAPAGIYLNGDKLVRVKVKSLQDRPVQVSSIEIPAEAPVQVRSVNESGSTWLEFQSKQISLAQGQPNQEALWSGKVQVRLRDGLVEEKVLVAIIK
ncbi:MAG: DUF1573 domain-containing protein [Blastochloris sp.]|nr:DUF1573 domain-containing protein [Blastochloris sp.]